MLFSSLVLFYFLYVAKIAAAYLTVYDLNHKNVIEEDLLKKYGAVEKRFDKGESIFQEGEAAVFYYQIRSGSVKMNNYTTDGQETIQGLFQAGSSFGEPAIFGDFPFPANAEAVEETCLICLERRRLLQLLNDHPDIAIRLLGILSQRLRFKAMLSKEIKGYDAEHQILSLLKYLKAKKNNQSEYQIDITRQTIANLTGLRVETVIRAIKSLKDEGKVTVRNRKLYL